MFDDETKLTSCTRMGAYLAYYADKVAPDRLWEVNVQGATTKLGALEVVVLANGPSDLWVYVRTSPSPQYPEPQAATCIRWGPWGNDRFDHDFRRALAQAFAWAEGAR